MKITSIIQAIKTCNSKYVEAITYSRLYMTNKEKNSAISVADLKKVINYVLWKMPKSIDSYSMIIVKNKLQVFEKQDELINWQEMEENYDIDIVL